MLLNKVNTDTLNRMRARMKCGILFLIKQISRYLLLIYVIFLLIPFVYLQYTNFYQWNRLFFYKVNKVGNLVQDAQVRPMPLL